MSDAFPAAEKFNHCQLEERAMSKFVALSFAGAAIWFATVKPVNAGDCQYYGWSYYPSYSYGWYYAPSAPVAAAPSQSTAPSSGQTARSDNGAYQSFSAEPGVAAAPAVQSAPAFSASNRVVANGGVEYTQNNPAGVSMVPSVSFGGFGGGTSVGSTQNNPTGASSSVSPFYGGSSGGTSGGTAGRPY
jgi:hypothetical protein